jgi:hypothetical protein
MRRKSGFLEKVKATEDSYACSGAERKIRKRIGLAFALMMLLSIVSASDPGNITVIPFEYRDFNNNTLPTVEVDLTVDCQAGTIRQHVERDGVPIFGARGYLNQVQYSVPLISSGSTDSNGIFVHKLPGNISYYTGIFTLTVEKSGYAKKELHFVISECFVNATKQKAGDGAGTDITKPGCTIDDDCLSSEICNTVSGECEKLGGGCGYAYHHQWIGYECCKDADCGSGRYCDEFSNECKVGTDPEANISSPNTTNSSPNITVECRKDGDCLPVVNCSIGKANIPAQCINNTCLRSSCEPPVQICPLGIILLLMPAIAFVMRKV